MKHRNQIAIDIFNSHLVPNMPANPIRALVCAQISVLLTETVSNNIELIEEPNLTMSTILNGWLIDSFSREDRETAVRGYELWQHLIAMEMEKPDE